MPAVLEVQNLRTEFRMRHSSVVAVDDISFTVGQGECVGIVGESGCGKSTTGLSIMRLLPNNGHVIGGSITLQGRDLATLDEKEMRQVRGDEVALIPQDPMTSLNPTMTIGKQIAEGVLLHRDVTKAQARQRALEVLTLVDMPRPAERLDQYPHELSGGLRQRVMIAMALACNPALLIADEPTTALDVTIQTQILELMLRVKDKRKDAAILLITHNLGVVAETCNRVIVMYGGKIQEVAPVKELFRNPQHPYTRGLLASLPTVDGERQRRLTTIPGNVPSILDLPIGCKFETRCSERLERCALIEPDLIESSPGHWVRCHLVNP